MASAHPFEIRESPIHGKGVFATRGISEGDLVGVALRRVARTGDPDSDLRQTLLARYLNHSPDPNAAFVPIPGGFGLRTLQDIPEGGEITADYAACERAVRPEPLPPQEDADPEMAHADPRIRILGHIGPFTVVEVDGPSVRRDLDPEFTNFGHHLNFPFIPDGELWIDREAHPDEAPFFIRHMLVEHRLMGSGMPRGKALDLADRAERDERIRAMGRRRGDTPAEHPKLRLFGRLRSGIEVWLVDGKAIRDTLYTDFTEGGNWLVYGWIPEGEIWIDNDVVPAERAFVLAHELAESLLMGRGMGYDKAHSLATEVEWSKRASGMRRQAADKGAMRRIRRWIADNVSDPENHCFFYAAALAALFPGLTLMRGRHSQQSPEDTAHFWTEDEDGNIIDPTAAQYHGGEYSGGAPVSLEANLEDVVKDPLFKKLPYQDQEKILAASSMPLSKRFIGFRRYTAGLPLSKRATALTMPFPSRTRRRLEDGRKSVTHRVGDEQGKYREGEVRRAVSYGGDDWGFDVEITEVATVPVSDLPGRIRGMVDFRNLPDDAEVDIIRLRRPSMGAKDHAYVGKRKEDSGNITYLYDEKHVAARNRKKEKRLQKLNKSLKRMRDKVRGDLSHEDERIRLAALAVALIDETYERVGNEESASDLKHYGVTGWLVKHVSLGKGKAAIRYVGKAGVRQSKEVKDKAVLKALRRACEGKGKGDRVLDGIGAKDVNAYLAPFEVTAKDIRGYHANKEMLRSLKESGKPPKGDGKAAKERFGKALEDAAKRVGHEPGTLKRQYLIPRIEQYYMEGRSVGNILACGLPLPLSKRAEDDPGEREESLGRFLPDKPAEQVAKDRPKRRRRTPEERRRIVERRQEERRRQERLERELAERRETGDPSGFPQLDRLLRGEASGIRLSKRAALMDIPPRMAGDATAWVRQAHANLCLALHRPLPPPAMVETELAALKGLEEMARADSLRLAEVAAGDLPGLEEKMLPRWDGRRFWLRLSGSGRPVGLFFIARRIAPGRWAYGASVQEWRRNPPLVPPMVPGSGHTLAAVLGALAERIGNLTRERTPPTDRDYQRNADLEAALKEAAAGAPPLDMLQMDSSYSQERELPIDISGWKYGRLVTSGLPWGKYTLEVAAQAPRDATASYQRYRPATRTETKEVPERLPRIVVYAGRLLRPGSARMFRMEQEKLAEAVRHEMVHLAQDLLKGALRLKMLAGLPPMSVRERGLDPSGFARPSRRTLRRQRRLWPESTFTGHREDAMRVKHQLQDVEFQSNLRDSIEEWRRLAEPMDPIQRRKFLGFWVRGDEKGYLEAHGKGELPSVPFSQSDVFRTLHNEARHDRARRDKWAAAARIMAREVADMLEPERTASAMPLSRRAASARDEELTDLYRLAAAALGRAGGYGALKPGWQRLFDDMADALWRKDLRLANRIIGRIMGDVLGERPPQPARRMGGRAP